ncbi:collagen alpha-1(VII) chain-like [Apus apus]|uniref:collagen alpha-1(VII) chain-like n=1 Tax=Apus apus TaxID=8895 RepID=UPI0021F878D6|nr:collagen alpha-1(VII) chain-like [Apus apus]
MLCAQILALAVAVGQYRAVAPHEACRTAEVADLLFLVGRSEGTGKENFQLVKDFISSTASSFENLGMGEGGVRLAVALYGEQPRMSIELTDYVTLKELLVAIQDLSFKGGSLKTGSALGFAAHTISHLDTLREDAAKAVVVITDGKSSDSVEEEAQVLQDGGVTVFAVGIKDADKDELNKIASEPTAEHVLYVEDFHLLHHVVPKLSRRLCSTASEPPPAIKQTVQAPVPPVTDFRVVEEGLSSLKVAWTPPLGKLEGYKIYIPRCNRPGMTYEQVLPGDVSSHVLENLQEDREYSVSIYAVYPQGPSQPVAAAGRTLKLLPVRSFLLQNETTHTLQAKWSPVHGATGYRLTWTSAEGNIQDVTLSNTYSYYLIQGLQPGTEHVVTISPIFGDAEGPVVSSKATTVASSTVQMLKVSEISSNSALVSWDSVVGATGYRVAWGPTPGSDLSQELLPAAARSYRVTGLSAREKYVFSVRPIFGDMEGPETTLLGQTVGPLRGSPGPSSPLTSAKLDVMGSSSIPPSTVGTTPLPLATTTRLPATPDTPLLTTVVSALMTTPPGPICGKFKADIGFLVDESSSIGQSNFKKVKDFLFRIVSYFPRIGPEGTQVAVAQYSEEPRAAFHFNQHRDRNSALQAIKGLSYVGGNTKTGRGLTYMLQEVFQSARGMRPDFPRVLVLMTDGRSQDDVVPPARVAHGLGIHVIAVGVSGADPVELNNILLQQNLQNVFYVSTFDDFPQILQELIEVICSAPQASEAQLPPGEFARYEAKKKLSSGDMESKTQVPDLPPAEPHLQKEEEVCGPWCLKSFRGSPAHGGYNPYSLPMKGEKGERGLPGKDGIPGLPGRPGRTGPPGPPGLMGLPGIQGDIGSPGYPGPVGPKGERGEPGYVLGGVEVIPGRNGQPGPPGQKGQPGVPGVAGAPGLPGPQGPPGISIKGEPGDSGIRGPRGRNGPKGDRGGAGEPGLPGPPGQKGDQVLGPPGKKGVRGDIGPTGAQGPRGDKGIQGDKGEKGSPGFGIPGQPGLKGDPGDRGNVGLSGKPGQKGEPGKKGTSGTKGEAGVPGEAGERGIRGPPGLPGRPGKQGMKGDKGQPGKDGIPGEKGHKGESGEPGLPGTPGSFMPSLENTITLKGDKGDCGKDGLKGERGPPGPKGEPGPPGRGVEMKDLERLFEENGIKLALLKDLSNVLLQLDGLVQQLGGSRTSKTSRRKQDSLVFDTSHDALASPEVTEEAQSLEIEDQFGAPMSGELPKGASASGSEPEYEPLGNPPEPLEETSEEGKKETDSRETNTSLSALAVPPLHPEDDLQGNQSMELLESLEDRVEGQPQQDTNHEDGNSEDGSALPRHLRARRSAEQKRHVVHAPGAPGAWKFPSGSTAYPGPHHPRRIKKEETGPADPPSHGQKGEMGAPGVRGDKGEKGQPGEMGEPGEKGTKGDRGENGQKGEPGIGFRGPVGQAGPPGYKGEPGAPGPPGAQGIQGIRGIAGTPGSQGDRGAPGVPGMPGQKGERGKRGRNGPSGPAGPAGSPGKEGVPGTPGPKGNKGEIGVGAAGPRGPRGLPGPQGDEGITGARGPSGLMGLKGFPGVKGERGDRGLLGPKGERGEPTTIFGPQGYKGSKGDPGERGLEGFDGDKGEKGEDGPVGEKGIKGEAGSKGVMGLFGTRGPVGQKGEPGEPGLPGSAGVPGIDGKNGNKGAKGDRGLQGQKGKAGEKGDPGTTGDIGQKGSKGLRGLPGRAGAPGAEGSKGEAGRPGKAGIPGLDGRYGPKGERGASGDNGSSGIPGEKGEKGAKGVPGLGGFKGQMGWPGKPGDAGPAGPGGPRGEPGSQGPRGKRGRSQLCPRGPPGVDGPKGEMGENGPAGQKGEKGDPGLSEEEVKEMVRSEVRGRCDRGGELGRILLEKGLEAAEINRQLQGYLQLQEHTRRDGESQEEMLNRTQSMTTLLTMVKPFMEPPSPVAAAPQEQQGRGHSQHQRREAAGQLPAPCLQPMDEGSCQHYTLLWYYHLEAKSCRPFLFGGCRGNSNRFQSKWECEEQCRTSPGRR